MSLGTQCDNDPSIIRILIETVKQIARLMLQIIVTENMLSLGLKN